MNEKRCFLVTVFYEADTRLMKCALKLNPADWMEYDTFALQFRAGIRQHLPLHVQSCGPIVDVEEIFELYEQPE